GACSRRRTRRAAPPRSRTARRRPGRATTRAAKTRSGASEAAARIRPPRRRPALRTLLPSPVGVCRKRTTRRLRTPHSLRACPPGEPAGGPDPEGRSVILPTGRGRHADGLRAGASLRPDRPGLLLAPHVRGAADADLRAPRRLPLRLPRDQQRAARDR